MAEELTREELVVKAKALGLKFAPALGTEKIKQMIKEAESDFDEDKYRSQMESKLRIEAEVKADFDAKQRQKKISGIKARKPSPEEIIVKTHPSVDIEFNNADGTETPLDCTYGGVHYLMFPTKQYHLPFGFVDHIQYHCQYPVFTQVPDKDRPGETKPAQTGWKPRFAILIVNPSQYAEAEKKARELNYIPIRERKVEVRQ